MGDNAKADQEGLLTCVTEQSLFLFRSAHSFNPKLLPHCSSVLPEELRMYYITVIYPDTLHSLRGSLCSRSRPMSSE
jgi:hypothetical protein